MDGSDKSLGLTISNGILHYVRRLGRLRVQIGGGAVFHLDATWFGVVVYYCEDNRLVGT